MGTNRVSDQLIDYKKKLLLHKEELRTKGVDTDKNFVGRISDMKRIVDILGDEYHSCRGMNILVFSLAESGAKTPKIKNQSKDWISK
jgi:hypothetical protein